MREHVRTSLPEGGKARRVYLLLRDDILSGLRAPGDRLPGENRLAEEFGVSRVTIRRALDALEANGLIERRAGHGTRIVEGAQTRTMAADVASLIPQIVELGRHSARLLSFSYDVPPAPVAKAMALPETARVQTAVRVRLAD